MATDLKELHPDPKAIQQIHKFNIYGHKFLVPLHLLSITETTNYFNYKPRFHGVFARNNLSRIKDGKYIINTDHNKSKRTHFVSLSIDINTVAYFDSFGIEHILLEVFNKINEKSITHNISRRQGNESIMREFFLQNFAR